MTDKGLNLWWLWCWMSIYMASEDTPGTIGNSKTDRALTKINKNGAVVKVRILVELGIYMNLAAILGAMLKYWT